MSDQTTDFELPVLRYDGDTLKDRMTGNAYNNILPARYCTRNDNGEVVETQEEVFERVARNVAVAEAVHLDETVWIERKHIKPDHPRREELFDKVLSATSDGQDEFPVPLTEERAKHVAYRPLVRSLDGSSADHLEQTAQRFENKMKSLGVMPNSPTIMNAGDELQQLSACFVNSPNDDMGSIHQTAKEAALTFQSGGGNGYSFSDLRPYGDTVGSTGGIASGPMTFMQTYDQMCETVAQGGARRGAQMGVMDITHPDIPLFIHAKNRDVSLAKQLKLNDPDDYTHNSFGEALEEARGLIDDEGHVPHHLRNAVEGHLSNFNISVGITEDFMEAVQAGEDYDLINPRTDEQHIATEETKELYGWFDLDEHVTVGEPLSIPADEIFTRVVKGAWENGEPGVIFLDRINSEHTFDVEEHPEYEVKATNPCAEQPLMEYEACNLMHINLSDLAADDAMHWAEFTEGVEFANEQARNEWVSDFLDQAIRMDELDERVDLCTRFLDNVVTMSNFPTPEIEETVSDLRKIGLGIMGYAQLIIQIGVEYGSPVGNEVARQLMQRINHGSKETSRRLANERGNFGSWEDSKFSDPTEYPEWFRQYVGQDPEKWEDGYPIRNHKTTTIAPTGTTSMLADTSGGCEPIYNVAYRKNVTEDVQGDEMLVEFDDLFIDTLRVNGIDVESVKAEADAQMEANEFDGIEGLSDVPDALGEVFVTTQDLSAEEHASVQCAFQEGVDSAISKTTNAPKDATVEDSKEVFEYIWRNGGKSVTFYRDGTRNKQVLTTRADNRERDDEEVAEEYLEEELGVSLDEVENLVGLADSLGNETETMADGGTLSQPSNDDEMVCDSCGGQMVYQEGCKKCQSCGAGKCEI